MLERQYINNDWLYSPCFSEEMKENHFDESTMEVVRVPHTNKELPYHYFDEKLYQFVSGYRKKIFAEEAWRDKHVFVTFEGVAHIAKVYMHGELIGEHYGGYTAFTIDLGPHLRFGEENTLVVEVDSRESNNIPPFGHVIDYMTYGGIYREVYLEVKETCYIKDSIVRTTNVCEAEKILELEVTVSEQCEDMILRYAINKITEDGPNWQSLGAIPITSLCMNAITPIKGVELWDTEHPQLYILRMELIKADELVDVKEVRFGFRECIFKEDGVYLNNKRIKLLGLNRHQSYPYVGYAMPKRTQRHDADILKYELGVNAVRTSHYPQSHHFIDRCDELGLLVFTEIPGWQHIGDDEWKEIALKHVEEMIVQYRNHPSIILWGVRINESQDDDSLYIRTNELAHRLDTTRQTGGVRCIKNSNLLEDVYTYNDFSHDGKTLGLEAKKVVLSEIDAPYLVSEFNGHMFPTKAFDSETHRLEHAMRHATVIDALFEHEDITGGFGWCMFDYNTHKDFGSGDRICYHGVLNMFRGHKLAASVYASQSEKKPVLEVSSNMNIGEHPGGYIGEVVAFTNADSINLYKNDEFIKSFYPNTYEYGDMPHPPIMIDDFIGELMEKKEGISRRSAERIKEVLFAVAKYGQHNLPVKYKIKMGQVMMMEQLKIEDGMRLYSEYIGNWGGQESSYRFEAIKNGEVVKIVHKTPVKKPYLKVTTDTTVLEEGDTYDVASVRIQVVDEHGEQLPYYQGVVMLQVEGEIELIGPSAISINGGSFGTYVRTKGTAGIGKLILSGDNLEAVSISYRINK